LGKLAFYGEIDNDPVHGDEEKKSREGKITRVQGRIVSSRR
jgi:hypothetical protein